MKKSLVLLMTAMACMFAGCSDDDEKNNDEEKQDDNTEIVVKSEVVGQVEDLSGTVMFNSVLGHWYIAVPEEGTYDNVTLYFPLNMEPDFCKTGQEVLFSGDLYEIVQKISVPTGTEYYAIKLTVIQKQSKDISA